MAGAFSLPRVHLTSATRLTRNRRVLGWGVFDSEDLLSELIPFPSKRVPPEPVDCIVDLYDQNLRQAAIAILDKAFATGGHAVVGQGPCSGSADIAAMSKERSTAAGGFFTNGNISAISRVCGTV